jgi:hypothetical protein
MDLIVSKDCLKNGGMGAFSSNGSLPDVNDNGLYNCGKVIYDSLTENGFFLFTSDCTKGKEVNHKGEMNKEYIDKNEIIKCFELSGLKYNPQYTHFIDRNTINTTTINILGLDLNTILKGWKNFDRNHKNIYDIIFLVFSKN